MIRKLLSSLALDRGTRASLQTQLCRGLKGAIQAGALRPGEVVPSSRELASSLRVSRNTVITAYDRLVGEGYLEPRPRSGLFVSESLALAGGARAATPLLGSAKPLPRTNLIGRVGTPLPFRPCQPDVSLFPLMLWNRMRARSLRMYGAKLLNYQSKLVLGLPELQQSLASYLRDSRGVRCDWRQIAITTGSQQALFLLAHLLLKPRDRVLMEDPGYLGARFAWMDAGATIQPGPVDQNGLVPPSGRSAAAVLIYTTPSRQFPTGACLPIARRLSLIGLATRWRAWIVEDDYDSEFRYTRPPLPSLHSLDPAGRVIYVGSMSKVLFPSLRIGYVVLPDNLVEGFAALRAVADDHGPLIDQAALAEFIGSGAFYTHIRRCRREYGERLAVFLKTAEEMELPLKFPHTDGGMNVAGFVDRDVDDGACSKALQAANFELPPLSHYSLAATARGLVFGFTAFRPSTIRAMLKRAALHLHSAFSQFR